MSRDSLATGLYVLVNLRLPWKPGGLCSIDGLEMEVTTTGDVLHAVLGPDSSISLSSCVGGGRERQRDVEVLWLRLHMSNVSRWLDVWKKTIKSSEMGVEERMKFYQLLLWFGSMQCSCTWPVRARHEAVTANQRHWSFGLMNGFTTVPLMEWDCITRLTPRSIALH